jgi:hypothetical protein
VLIGNELNTTDHFSRPDDDYRWVSASASYILDNDTIDLISATAGRYAPGPEIEREITWNPRTSYR